MTRPLEAPRSTAAMVRSAVMRTPVSFAWGSRRVHASNPHDVQLEAQQICRCFKLGDPMSGAQGPVVGYAAGRPGVSPLPRVASEVDSGGGVPDGQQRTRHDMSLGRDHAERAVAQLAQPERGDWPMGNVELNGHAPSAFPVVDAESAQQGLGRADSEVGRSVVAHLYDVVAEVQRL